jgi:hypothetical protein
MQTYIALVLLYNKDLLEESDPETGVLRLVERGFVRPGEPITLDEGRAAILLELGYIAPAPEPTPESEPDDQPA